MFLLNSCTGLIVLVLISFHSVSKSHGTFYMKFLRTEFNNSFPPNYKCLLLSQDKIHKSINFSQSSVLISISLLQPENETEDSLEQACSNSPQINSSSLVETFSRNIPVALSYLFNSSSICSTIDLHPSGQSLPLF